MVQFYTEIAVYKWFGKTILKIGMFEPSSKTCNVCGYHNSKLTLNDREWLCPECKTLHDRDINAAINIKKFALMEHEVEPVDLEKTVTAKYEAGCPSLHRLSDNYCSNI